MRPATSGIRVARMFLCVPLLAGNFRRRPRGTGLARERKVAVLRLVYVKILRNTPSLSSCFGTDENRETIISRPLRPRECRFVTATDLPRARERLGRANESGLGELNIEYSTLAVNTVPRSLSPSL